MAMLTGLNIDANVEESNGGFTVLPAGNYKVCLVGDELVDNKSGSGKILKLKLQVIEGQYAGEILKDNLNITNPSPVAQKIGQGTLKRICNICSAPFPPQDTNSLMGKPMVITVQVEEFKSNNTGNMLKSNKIKKYDNATAAVTETNQAPPQQQKASGW